MGFLSLSRNPLPLGSHRLKINAWFTLFLSIHSKFASINSWLSDTYIRKHTNLPPNLTDTHIRTCPWLSDTYISSWLADSCKN